MGLYLNPGNDSFREAVQSEIYVDKSLLIAYTNKVIGTAQKAICVSRPRRFGKSIAADMLTAYYGKECDSSTLFSDLKIAQNADYQKHLNQEYVIHADINSFLHRRNPQTRQMVTALEAIDLLHMEIIAELREEFPESVDESMIDLPSALAKISENEKVKFVIIIDEWDAIFREAKQDIKAQEVYLDLLHGLFKDAPSKKFLKLAYITGILPIKKYGTQSALNNFDEFTMIQSAPISEFVGFTEEEVERLYRDYQMNFEEAKRWYDGYVLGDDLHIYNPKSVVDSIRRKKIANYWTRTESYESLRDYIAMNYDGLKDAIVNMLAGGKCRVNASRFQNDMTSLSSRDDILTLLIHLGYLAYDEKTESVYIPNEEILNEFETAIEGANWSQVIEAIKASDKLLQDTWNRNEETVAAAIEKVHQCKIEKL